MKEKTKKMYKMAYSKFRDICDANCIRFDSIEITTDQERNLFTCFSETFWDCSIDHVTCKKHFTSNLELNLGKLGLKKYITKKGNDFSPDFFIFYEQVKLLVLLPSYLILPMLSHLIEKIENKVDGIDHFLVYLQNRITTVCANHMSFFERILKSKKYVHQTTNASESLNGHLNRFIFSLSKSRKLTTISRHLRTFYISDFRRLEEQFLVKKSDYEPSPNAQINYNRAKNFIRKIIKIGTYPNKTCLRKISLLMEPSYFFGDKNSNPE